MGISSYASRSNIIDGPTTRGHALMLNMRSYLPFVLTINPEEISTSKNINYVVAPNIGGASKKRYFAGFDAKEVSLDIKCIDMQHPLGVTGAISYFDQLRNPDPGIFGTISQVFGNENYPPPQIMYQFGVSMIPLIWDVLSVQIVASHFFDDKIRGVIGIPKQALISLQLALVEDSVLNKANKIAEAASQISGSVNSILREGLHRKLGRKKVSPWQVADTSAFASVRKLNPGLPQRGLGNTGFVPGGSV